MCDMHRKAFWWGTDVGDFLIGGLTVSSTGGLVAICIFIAVMAFIFEYLRYVQTKQRQKELKIRAKQIRLLCSTESSALLARTVTNPQNPLNITLVDRALMFGSEVSLWLLLQNLGYILMLSVMLYDGWFLCAAVVGGGIGYFIFGQKFMKINLQNCRIIRETYCTQICGETDTVKRDGESTPGADAPSTSQSSLDCLGGQAQTTTEISVHNEYHRT